MISTKLKDVITHWYPSKRRDHPWVSHDACYCVLINLVLFITGLHWKQ